MNLLCNGSSVALRQVLKATWSGELNNNYNVTIYVSCNNERRDCGCYCEIKPGHERAISKTSSFIALNSKGLGSYFKTGSSFVDLTWLLTGISKG